MPADVAADLQPGDVVHVVRSGESLVAIAETYFVDSDRWKQIYADNRLRPQPSQVFAGRGQDLPPHRGEEGRDAIHRRGFDG